MINSLNLADSIKEVESRIFNQEEVLGKGLMQPFSNTNSGSRKIMFAVHREHNLPLIHSEVPIVATGYENEFGHNSSSFIKAESDYQVLCKLPKFSKFPDYHYWAILLDIHTKQLHTVERISYRHITETYGYQYNNNFLDTLKCDDYISKGQVVKKSTSFDDYNNRMDGVNLTTAYISCDTTMEDGIILSESAAKKFDSPLFKKVPIIVNDNDILLNLYGDNDNYSSFPNIGEEVKQGLLCAIRREKRDETLFTQSYNRLKDIMMSDDKFTVEGEIVDINIYCNKPENLETSYHNNQMKYYYDENIRFCNLVISTVRPLLEDKKYTMSYDLQKLYYTCEDIVAGKQYYKDRPFSNIIMEIIVLEKNVIREGDKLSDRYGGKGVISKIVPDHLMPRLDNGEYVEILYNSSTCVNRVNPGQLFETSITHIGSRIIDFICTNTLDTIEGMELIYKYLKKLNPEQADYLFHATMHMEDEELAQYIGSICADSGIMISLKPVSDSLDLDKLKALYLEFPWATQCKITVPMTDSNGNIRYIEARRSIVCGKKYIYRLKQYAEEKFSVTSLSATNIRNENSRSKANKVYKGLFTKTPIRFGDMETGDMAHLGMETVIVNLMLHSTSPHGRRMAEDLLTGDPFDIDIKLDEDAKNRSVEILDVYLKTMGLKLTFEKVYKNRQSPILKHTINKMKRPLQHPLYKLHPDEVYDSERIVKLKEIERPNGLIRPILKQPLIKHGIKPLAELKKEQMSGLVPPLQGARPRSSKLMELISDTYTKF